LPWVNREPVSPVTSDALPDGHHVVLPLRSLRLQTPAGA
jgi:hypothetical protein